MEFLRYRKDAWGQEILTGISWDLIWVFVSAAIAFILVHMLYIWLSRRRREL